MPRKGSPIARWWHIAAFGNLEDVDLERVDAALAAAGQPTSKITYAAWQFEKGLQGGGLHIQATVHCVRPMRRSAVQQSLHIGNCHCAPCRDDEASEDYTTKADTRAAGPWVAGVRPSQGTRSDLIAVRDTLRATRSLRAVAEEHLSSFVQHNRAWSLWLMVVPPEAITIPRQFIVYWGPAGSGKTYDAVRRARTAYGKENVYELVLGNTGNWWDGAVDPKCVVIDDFRGSTHFTVQLLKLLTDPDGRPTAVDTKHGRCFVRPEMVIITSEQDPATWYPSCEWPGIQRRITELQHWPTPRRTEPELDRRLGWIRDGTGVARLPDGLEPLAGEGGSGDGAEPEWPYTREPSESGLSMDDGVGGVDEGGDD